MARTSTNATDRSFVVMSIPKAQPRAKATTIGGHARMYTPKTADAFKASVQLAFRDSGLPMLDGPVTLRACFVMPRPKSKVWKAREMPREAHAKKPDLDNLCKSVMDALSGLAWRDDAQVCETIAHKQIAAGGESPHVWLSIEPHRFEQISDTVAVHTPVSVDDLGDDDYGRDGMPL